VPLNETMRILLTWLVFFHLLHADERYEFERPLMGTLFRIQTYAPSQEVAQKASMAAFAEAEAINEVASDYIADSELLQLSKKPTHQPIVVSMRLFCLLEQARHMAVLTEGAFDPTLGPLTKIWRESRRRQKMPAAEMIQQARESSGYRLLALDASKRTITLKASGMRLDLGGIAKGQAADAMLAIFFQHQLRRTSITAGGDVRMGEPPPGQKGWTIGVRALENNLEKTTLILSDCAVSTSGDLQQAVKIDGVRYAHIIDPQTGLGLSRPVAATVIAPTAAQSDALATACCVLMPEQARALICKIPGCTLRLPDLATESGR
jgi:thiamine biosynthesis lipoprotein